jgi:chemotaxis protein methyltransferase CheR
VSGLDLQFLANLCRTRSGQRIDLGRPHIIENRLAPVARREGFAGIAELLAAVQSSRDDKLIWRVVEAMAQGESVFFRDRVPFEMFQQDLLPHLARRRGDEPIRVWSAACGTGQEAYSLAMLIEESGGLSRGADFRLFGSDLSERALEKAQSGLYTQFEVQRGLSAQRLVRHFEQRDEMWALSPRLRQMIRWRRINLIGDLSALGRFDVIFCRNLISTLEEAYAARVLGALASALSDDGFLVLGMAESVPVSGVVRPVSGQPGLFSRDPAFRVAA